MTISELNERTVLLDIGIVHGTIGNSLDWTCSLKVIFLERTLRLENSNCCSINWLCVYTTLPFNHCVVANHLKPCTWRCWTSVWKSETLKPLVLSVKLLYRKNRQIATNYTGLEPRNSHAEWYIVIGCGLRFILENTQYSRVSSFHIRPHTQHFIWSPPRGVHSTLLSRK